MKKKIALLTLALALSMSLSGCMTKEDVEKMMYEPIGSATELDGELECVRGNATCSEWRDTETGVHYFYTQRGGLELRINADGTPYVD